MSRFAYVNGRYTRHRAAEVHVEDRGYQFADGVYEVILIHRGRLIDRDEHLARLDFSLSELQMAWPMAPAALRAVMGELIRLNRITESGTLYIQVTRGVAPRVHAFPVATTRSSLVMTVRSLRAPDGNRFSSGVSVITIPDIRWGRPDIKSVSLLPNVLGKQQAVAAGAEEAWMVDEEGRVTEGTASNAWIVDDDGTLITRRADNSILNGITRRVVLCTAAQRGLSLIERPFTIEEAKASREAFLTSTTSMVKPVIRIDQSVIGSGTMGPVTAHLQEIYAEHLRKQTDFGS